MLSNNVNTNNILEKRWLYFQKTPLFQKHNVHASEMSPVFHHRLLHFLTQINNLFQLCIQRQGQHTQNLDKHPVDTPSELEELIIFTPPVLFLACCSMKILHCGCAAMTAHMYEDSLCFFWLTAECCSWYHCQLLHPATPLLDCLHQRAGVGYAQHWGFTY